MLHGGNAAGDQHAVFAHQGHHIGYSAQGHQVAVFPEYFFLISGDGSGQLKGYAHTGKVREGILRILPMGIYHGHSLRQNVLALMVVSDDQINAQFPAFFCFLYGGDAAVHSDNEVYILGFEIVDGGHVETIALFQPGWNIPDTVCAAIGEIIRQETGGSNAVHIIVAVDGDFFSTLKGQGDSGRCLIHVRKKHGVKETFPAGSKEAAGLIRGVKSSGNQNCGSQW